MLTAVVVPFPETSHAVDGWRERTCLDRPSIGIPAHVTLLFPFVPSARIGQDVISELTTLFAATNPFAVSFRRTARFPGTLYLAPEPDEPFVRMTEAIVQRWPEYPPYEGEFDTVLPHLTVAHGDEPLLAEVEADVAPKLPIEASADEVLLLEELEPEWVRWGERARFALRGARQ